MLKRVKLKDISKAIGSGITPLRSNPLYWENGTIPWLKTEQLGESEIYDTSEKITQFAIDDTSIKIFPVNTLSIAMYGEGRTRGNVSILKAEMATNQACCNIIVDEEKAYYKYVYYFLKTQYENLRSLSSGVRKNLNSNDIKEFGILLPDDLRTQKRIASILSSLDAKISLNNRINAELEAMAKTIYDYWFVQFDFPDKKGKPYKASGGKMVWSEELKREIPEGWEVKTLDSICSRIQSGGTPASTNKEYYSGSINWFTTKELQDDFVLSSESRITEKAIEESSAKLFPSGTVVIAIYAAPTVGRLGILTTDSAFNQACCGLIANEMYCSLEFIFMTLVSYRRKLNIIASGTTQKNLSVGAIKELFVVTPPLEIMSSFTNVLNPLFNKKELLLKENQKLTELRDWLLPMLMNGQIKIKDAEVELAMAAEPEVSYSKKKK
ncbi:MAG: restriction endonuclease subunit S [Flammeovirgaceae bacterium]|jgi:type I restriction enzyme S subunit|nr:restriction endonuclease subunit S [Flammeovirgaceae bacterium]